MSITRINYDLQLFSTTGVTNVKIKDDDDSNNNGDDDDKFIYTAWLLDKNDVTREKNVLT